ncbi:hypothetical protein [Paraburkholderia strydomiana]
MHGRDRDVGPESFAAPALRFASFQLKTTDISDKGELRPIGSMQIKQE